jgi:hypothetical protein
LDSSQEVREIEKKLHEICEHEELCKSKDPHMNGSNPKIDTHDFSKATPLTKNGKNKVHFFQKR